MKEHCTWEVRSAVEDDRYERTPYLGSNRCIQTLVHWPKAALMSFDMLGYLQSSHLRPRREIQWFCIPCWAALPPRGQRSSVSDWLRQHRLSCSPHDHSLNHPATNTHFSKTCIWLFGKTLSRTTPWKWQFKVLGTILPRKKRQQDPPSNRCMHLNKNPNSFCKQ